MPKALEVEGLDPVVGFIYMLMVDIPLGTIMEKIEHAKAARDGGARFNNEVLFDFAQRMADDLRGT